MANKYDIGQLVRLSVTFTVAGSPTDPSAITLEITDPDGDTVEKDENEVTKDDTGDYHFDIITDLAGKWVYQWSGTAGVITAATGYFWAREDLAV